MVGKESKHFQKRCTKSVARNTDLEKQQQKLKHSIICVRSKRESMQEFVQGPAEPWKCLRQPWLRQDANPQQVLFLGTFIKWLNLARGHVGNHRTASREKLEKKPVIRTGHAAEKRCKATKCSTKARSSNCWVKLCLCLLLGLLIGVDFTAQFTTLGQQAYPRWNRQDTYTLRPDAAQEREQWSVPYKKPSGRRRRLGRRGRSGGSPSPQKATGWSTGQGQHSAQTNRVRV